MRIYHLGMITLLILGASAGCHVDDADRCDDPYVYENFVCVLPDDTDTVADSDTGDIYVPGTDSEVSGLGDVCTGPADCAGLEADYCAIPPAAASGNCAIRNCVTDPDECPADLVCCDLPPDGLSAGIPNLCMPQADYDYYDGLVGCHG